MNSNLSYIGQVRGAQFESKASTVLTPCIDSDYYILPVVGRFHVWQVKLGDDGNSLVAEPLHTTNGHAFIDALALGRRLIACTMSEHTGSWAEIIWWEQYSTSSRRARFATGDGPIVS